MALKFRKSAIKFLEKANPENVERIREKLRQLLVSIEEQGVIPFKDLDIKKMKGDWEGFTDFVLVRFALFLQFI